MSLNSRASDFLRRWFVAALIFLLVLPLRAKGDFLLIAVGACFLGYGLRLNGMRLIFEGPVNLKTVSLRFVQYWSYGFAYGIAVGLIVSRYRHWPPALGEAVFLLPFLTVLAAVYSGICCFVSYNHRVRPFDTLFVSNPHQRDSKI